MNDDESALAEFSGITRMFPLPGLVMFPGSLQPLHIFEPRYRAMTAEALAGDRLITMVCVPSDWESTDQPMPEIQSVACLGRIVADQLLPDGRYNLMLRGVARIRLIEELPVDTLFRQARAEPISETAPDDIEELTTLRNALADLMLPRFSEGPVREQISSLFHGDLTLGRLCDVLAFALPIPPTAKQALLESADAADRARRLMEEFQAVLAPQPPSYPRASGRKFPPDFSIN